MTRFTRIVALTCCVLLVHAPLVAAEDNSPSLTTALTSSVVNATLPPGPIRQASMSKDTAKMLIAETTWTRRPAQEGDDDKGSWVERHPVWTGAILGFSAGFALTYLATQDSDDGEFLKVMSPGAGAMFWGGVSAGVGALAGWGIGRNRDDD